MLHFHTRVPGSLFMPPLIFERVFFFFKKKGKSVITSLSFLITQEYCLRNTSCLVLKISDSYYINSVMLTPSCSLFVCISEINKTETDNFLNHCKFNVFIETAFSDCRKVASWNIYTGFVLIL